MRSRKFVVGIDGSDGSYRALGWAIDLANDLDVEIIAVHAIEFPVYVNTIAGMALMDLTDGDWRDSIRAAFELEWCGPLAASGLKYRAELVEGNPASALMTIADGEEADLIIVASRGKGGFKELMLGSVSHQVAHHSKRPVVIVPPDRS